MKNLNILVKVILGAVLTAILLVLVFVFLMINAMDFRINILIFTTVLILFLIAAIFFIYRIFIKPIRIISENASKIDFGIFNRKLPPTLSERKDEIGKLARSFAYMSGSIQEVINEIDHLALAIGAGTLDKRTELTFTEGEFNKIICGVNSALDVICSHLDAIPVALALFNEKKDIIYRNYAMDEFLLMHGLEEQDANLLEHIAGSGSVSTENALDPLVQAIFDPSQSNPEPFTADIALLGHDGGSNFSLTLQRTGISSQLKNTVCAILLLNDVTLLTRAKIDAEAASRTKSDFLSRMSHEIRTPMNAVLGMTHIAKSSGEIVKIKSCLDQIENSSHHLLGVINDILDFSKIESGKLLLDISEFSLSENLDFVVSMMLPKARERNINILLTIQDLENDGISADSLRINQVLINLLSNAIKFSQEGSEVLLNVRELGFENGFSTYKFEVIDYGIGINDYQASKLFRPFEQADGSITRNYGGTGLGLTISKNLVEMMGGKISLQSKEGEGSIFSFTLICASKPKIEDKPEFAELIDNEEVYDFSGKRCLVVDDIEINREIVVELLSVTNLNLETAANGREAVEKFKSRGKDYFDIILMDMQMPIMDGCNATRLIRKAEKEWGFNNGKVPIIAMTANVLQEDIEKAMESGMNAHLGKPIVLDITLKTIQEQLTKNT